MTRFLDALVLVGLCIAAVLIGIVTFVIALAVPVGIATLLFTMARWIWLRG